MDYPKLLISGQYNAFNEGWNGAGVYACSGNYVSSVFKTPWYIGSAEDLQKRIEWEHISPLERNKHRHNQPLQFSWNKHNGKEGFIWFFLESCPPDQTLIREQFYLDLYRPFVDEFGGFNISHDAKSGMKGRNHTEETKNKMSESAKGRIPPPENKGKPFKVLNPDGEIIEDQNLKKFCIENNLNYRSMVHLILDQTINNHKGYTRYNDTKDYDAIKNIKKQAVQHLAKEFELISPAGEVIKGKHIRNFSEKYGLNKVTLGRLISGKIKSYKGWKNNTEI